MLPSAPAVAVRSPSSFEPGGAAGNGKDAKESSRRGSSASSVARRSFAANRPCDVPFTISPSINSDAQQARFSRPSWTLCPDLDRRYRSAAMAQPSKETWTRGRCASKASPPLFVNRVGSWREENVRRLFENGDGKVPFVASAELRWNVKFLSHWQLGKFIGCVGLRDSFSGFQPGSRIRPLIEG